MSVIWKKDKSLLNNKVAVVNMADDPYFSLLRVWCLFDVFDYSTEGQMNGTILTNWSNASTYYTSHMNMPEPVCSGVFLIAPPRTDRL